VGRKSRAKREAVPAQSASASQVEAAGPKPPRRALLWVILLLVPVAVLGGAELALRATGYGRALEPLFIASPGQPEYLQANPRVVTRFFTDPAQAPPVSIETAYFRRQKQPGSFRVFVQGESSAAGFPYGLGASLAGALDQRLERAFPSREIEVISTAMAAVNSYALLDFTDEIIAQQPDAVVVYVGHNEFLGILGVGSSMQLAATPRLTRAFLAAREWRLFQLMSQLYARFRPAGGTAAGASGESLMARVAGERSIALQSDLYRRGVQQFEANLERLLGRYLRAGVPVLIGTLASNERDQLPLAILAGVDSDAAGAAQTAYHSAQDADEAGNHAAAREGYAWARDLDPLRFRGPADFNSIVARTAKAQGARVVDVHGAFVAASANGLIGASLLLEHVHPNLDGYFLLADAFFAELVANGLPGAPEVDIAAAEARAGMPVSEIDRFLGDYKVLRIKAGWPFSDGRTPVRLPAPASEAERLAQELYHERISWPEAHDRLRRHYQAQGDRAGHTHVTAILADAFPFTGSLQFEAAAALIELSRPRDALRYSRRGVELEPRNVNQWLVHAHGLLLSGRERDGRAALGKALEIEPANPTARKVLDELGAE
jgi:lysophospholipase L1-like esterase